MNLIWEALVEAAGLIARRDPDLPRIAGLSPTEFEAAMLTSGQRAP